MANVQQLVDQLNAGTTGPQWSLVGSGQPVEETSPVAVPANAAAGTPASTQNRGTGRYYVVIQRVQDGQTYQRAMPLKADQIKGGLVVPQSGVNDTVPDLTPDNNGKVDPAATKPNPSLYTGDLKNLSWSSGGPITDVPVGAKQPSATGTLDKLNSAGDVIPPGTPTNPSDPATVPKQLRDSSTGTVINLATDPAGTLHDLGNDVILVKPDGSYTTVASKPKEASQINVPGVGLVNFDPSKPEGQQAEVLIKTPDQTAPTTQTINGITYQYDKGSQQWIKTDLPQQQDIGYTLNDPNSKYIIFYDKQGKEVSRTEKPDWKAPINVQPGTAPAADQVSATIPSFNPQTGALEFVPNPNQMKASDATSQLAQQLGLKVAAGSMSEKQAQDIITGAVNTMNAQSQQTSAQASMLNAQNQQQTTTETAAGDILRNTQANAQTGAGLLQTRATQASGLLQNILGQATGNKNFMSAPAGLGEQLVGGISDWTAGLMGGQSTMDSAARLVQMADPKSNMADPASQTAVGVLSQMLDKYQQLTGTPHPAVAATQAANASQQAGGVVAPVTAQPAPVAGTAPYETAAQSMLRNGIPPTPATYNTNVGFVAPPTYVAPPQQLVTMAGSA